MTHQPASFPAGYRHLEFDDIDSTNAEAMRQAGAGAAEKLWITAVRQSAGRGRVGRRWESGAGNLFASLLLRPDCTLETAVQLAFVAGLAACDAVAALSESVGDKLALKWPNDILLGNAKLGGVLLESSTGANVATPVVAIGTGLNLAHHPEDTAMAATDLASHGIHVTPGEAFSALAAATARWTECWDDGAGWDEIRDGWVERALPVGTRVRVRLGNDEKAGRILGIDAAGALRLEGADGDAIRITTGDVFLL